MKKQLLVGILVLLAVLAGPASAWARVYINNDTNYTVRYKTWLDAWPDSGWGPEQELGPWDHEEHSGGLWIWINTGKETKKYHLEDGRSYRFLRRDGTIDLYQSP